MDGYANLIASRLRKLAVAGSTGMLPVSGHGDGAIFFRTGQVIYARSSRTPAPAPIQPAVGLAALGLLPADAPGGPAGAPAVNGSAVNGSAVNGSMIGTALVAAPSLARLADMLALTEPTIDAITDLLSSESRYAKFRPDVFPVTQMGPIPVGSVLTEVERRRHLLRQLAPVVTADTPIVRNSSPDAPSFQVSAPQWTLLRRVGDGSTARSLALTLDHSVFGTTIEVYRLLALGLLAVPGRPLARAGERAAGQPAQAMSFMRAVSGAGGGDERGSDA